VTVAERGAPVDVSEHVLAAADIAIAHHLCALLALLGDMQPVLGDGNLQKLAFHQHAVGDDHCLPVVRLDCGEAPADVHHPAGDVSNLIQSPTPSESSSCRAMLPRMLPRVSCVEKASTAVITAEVAIMPLRAGPAWRSRTIPQATS